MQIQSNSKLKGIVAPNFTISNSASNSNQLHKQSNSSLHNENIAGNSEYYLKGSSTEDGSVNPNAYGE